MLRRLARSRLARVFTRFAAGSAVGAVCSQLTFLLLFGVLGASAAASGIAAFVAGAGPNFVIHRYWTWQRSGRVGMRWELALYLAVIAVNGLVATGITAGVDRLVGTGIDDHAVRTVVLAVIFSASYVLLFVLKFASLDRLVFSGRTDPARRTERSRHQVPTITRA
jgi:putative flippase GtrA